jgi:hypothetical protein
MGGSGSLFEAKLAKPYTIDPMASQKNPFVMPLVSVCEGIPTMEVVLCGIFRYPKRYDAGGNVGISRVTIVTSKKPAAHAAPNVLPDIPTNVDGRPFFHLYEFSVLI